MHIFWKQGPTFYVRGWVIKIRKTVWMQAFARRIVLQTWRGCLHTPVPSGAGSSPVSGITFPRLLFYSRAVPRFVLRLSWLLILWTVQNNCFVESPSVQVGVRLINLHTFGQKYWFLLFSCGINFDVSGFVCLLAE